MGEPEMRTSWTATRAAMTLDRQQLANVLGRRPNLLHAGLWALRLYRVSRFLYGRGSRLPARLVWAFNMVVTGADLDVSGPIGPGTVLLEPWGVILYGDLGPNCIIGFSSGVGGVLTGKAQQGATVVRPVLGAGVVLGDHCMVLGNLGVGEHARLGAGCIVLEDIPAGAEIEARPVDWRPIRVKLVLRAKPDPDRVRGLYGCIRADVARTVLENGASENIGRLRFWGHLILPGVLGVVVFRFGQWLHGAGWRRAGAAIAWLVGRLFGLFLHPGSSIGPGLFVPHPVNVRFCGTAGANLTLYPAAAVGPEAWPRYRDRLVAEQCPTLGVGVRISARGNVVGPVTIGDNATVGIAAQVRRDLAAGLSAVPRRNWTYVTVAEPERAHEP